MRCASSRFDFRARRLHLGSALGGFALLRQLRGLHAQRILGIDDFHVRLRGGYFGLLA